MDHHHHEEDEELSAILLGGALALGFLSMFVFSSLFHDHDHHAHAHGTTSTRSAVIGITLHAATDGLAIGAAAASGDLAAGLLIVFAVLIHKFPEAVTLGVFSLNDHQDELKVYRDVGIFALNARDDHPRLLPPVEPSHLWIGLAMLFAGGTLLYVAALDALPDVHDPETGTSDLLLVLGGVAAMTVVLVLAELLGLGHAH